MKRQESTLRRILRGPAIYLLVVVGALWLFLSFATRQPQARKLSLTAFQSAIREGDVRSATFLERDQKVVGELKDGTRYETTYPEQYQDDLTKELVQAPSPVVDLRTAGLPRLRAVRAPRGGTLSRPRLVGHGLAASQSKDPHAR